MSDNGHNNDHGSPFIQHHYDDAKHQFDSGKLGIWFFLAQEVLFFSALFVAYIVYRSHHPEIYNYAHAYLDVKWGAINTAVLIISSLTAAWSVRCAQLGQQGALKATLAVTILCAFGFLGIKYVEYKHKFHEGLVFGSKFDPCIAPDHTPLLTKTKACEGVKSSVVWEAGKAKSGCMALTVDADEKTPFVQAATLDAQPNQAGIQAECEVSDGSATFPACAGRPVHGKVAGTPCYTIEVNPNVCGENRAGVLVHYGDAKLHSASIAAKCKYTLAPPAPNDVYARPAAEPHLGVAAVAPVAEHHAHGPQGGPPPRNTNMFFSIYFAMTGLHGIHVIAGIIVYLWLLVRATKGHFGPTYFGPIDYAALYWHLVDLIWIFLFPLLYLIH